MIETIYDMVNKNTNSQINTDLELYKNKKTSMAMLVGIMIITLLIFVLFLVLGKYLWNTVLTKCVTVVKPVDSLVQFLGLYVLLHIILSK